MLSLRPVVSPERGPKPELSPGTAGSQGSFGLSLLPLLAGSGLVARSLRSS